LIELTDSKRQRTSFSHNQLNQGFLMKFKIALAAALIAAGSANAATTPVSSFTNPLAKTEIAQSGNLAYFNASLGTLTGATLTLSDSFLTTFSFKNTAANPQTFKYSTSMDMFFTSTNNAGLAAFLSANSVPTLAYQTPFVTLAAGATSVVYAPPLQTQSPSYDLSGILTALTGTGNFNVSCSSITGTGFSGGGGNITTVQDTTANCGASIVYTYTAAVTPTVPVPASAALLGLGLLAAGAARRRKA
jgi:hypothetical protein